MRAIRIHERGNAGVMLLEDIVTPIPQQGEVLIKVVAAGVNYADTGERNGQYPNLKPLPLTLGFEVAGNVVVQGPGVTTPAIGTRVVALVEGGYAEYAVARAEVVVSLPEEVSFAQATAVPVQGQTAYLALTKAARLKAGDVVLVHAAAGGVGSLAVQLAKAMGAGMVIGTTTTKEKMQLIRDLGADSAISTLDGNWVEQVMRMTRGRGVDIVLDAVGGSIGQPSVVCLALFGRLVTYGSLQGKPTPFVMQMLIQKCLSVIGYNTIVQPLEDQLEASQALLRFIADGQVRVVLDHTFLLTEAAAAHQAIEAGQTKGKVVLSVD